MMGCVSLPPVVVPRIDGYLKAVDDAVPGLVTRALPHGIDLPSTTTSRPSATSTPSLCAVRGPTGASARRWPASTRTDPSSTCYTPRPTTWRADPPHPFAAVLDPGRVQAHRRLRRQPGRMAHPGHQGPPLCEVDHSMQRAIWFRRRRPCAGGNLANLDDYWVTKTAEGERVRPEFWGPVGSRGCSGSCSASRAFTVPSSPTRFISKSAAGVYAPRHHRRPLARRPAGGDGPCGSTGRPNSPKEPDALVADAVAPRQVAHRRCSPAGRRVSRLHVASVHRDRR